MCLITLLLLVFICSVLAMALFTLLERKVLGYMQLRKGPNKVAMMGIAQPLADVIKLLTKEQSIPSTSNRFVLLLGPSLALMLALLMWGFLPSSYPSLFAFSTAVVFLCISSMNVYATLLSGWASNSKYALLGALRAVAQTISYEVSMALVLLSALTLNKTLELNFICSASYCLALFMLPLACVWLVTCLAETNRTPFDLAEGESEIVSGFNVEYSATPLAFIFMAEYMNIILMSALTSVLFMYTSSPLMLSLWTMFFNFMLIWVRGTMPRMRYDMLMSLTWKSLLPLSLMVLILAMFATNL